MDSARSRRAVGCDVLYPFPLVQVSLDLYTDQLLVIRQQLLHPQHVIALLQEKLVANPPGYINVKILDPETPVFREGYGCDQRP